MNKFLNEIELKRIAPSVFAMEASHNTSDKYSLIPTIASVNGLKDMGFFAFSATESRCRNKDNKPFVKHMLRFRKENAVAINGLIPEIVLVNSHDGTSSYQLRAGIYRIVCSNGLIVGTDAFCQRIRHQGDVVSKVVNSANELAQTFPETLEIADRWSKIPLQLEHKQVYAQAAAMLKWDLDELAIDPSRLLTVRREADKNQDVWTTFNIVQENLIKGGLRYRKPGANRQSTRGVNSVSENTRLNTALWTLTEKLAEVIK